MKTLWYSFILSLFCAASAQALTVSNLDHVDHRIVFEETPGTKVIRRITPGQTIHKFTAGGEVYIEGKTVRLRPYAHDVLVIWGDGNLMIQKRRQLPGGVF